MSVTVRPAVAADAEVIARQRYPEPTDAPERPAYADWVGGAMQRGSYLGLLAETGEEVVAGVGLVLLDWGPSRGSRNPIRARLVNVWTHPEHRRQGLARRLVKTLLAEARARQIGLVSLGTTEMGQSLYESLGFKAYPHEMLLKLEDQAFSEDLS